MQTARNFRNLAFASAGLVLLLGCGGGGNAPAPSIPPAVSLTPSSLVATLELGSPGSFRVRAVPSSQIDSNPYTFVVDSKGILSPNFHINANGDGSFTSFLETRSDLPLGIHTGNLEVRICKDASGLSQYPGSPVQFPYTITVTPVVVSPTVTASPSTLNATITKGLSSSLELHVNFSSPPTGPVYASYGGTGGISTMINGFYASTPDTTGAYTVRISTDPSLSEGPHSCTIYLSMYKDSARLIHYPGSPVKIPCTLTVNP